MERCSTCGNDYDKSFQVIAAGRTYIFDCLECAIHALAPTCERCGCRIIGHGMEGGGSFYCLRIAPACKVSKGSKTACVGDLDWKSAAWGEPR